MTELTGFDSSIDAILSGQFELCVPRGNADRPFIRNASFNVRSGVFSDVVSVPITADDAAAIKNHHCVVPGLAGSLLHYHTRRWPVYSSAK